MFVHVPVPSKLALLTGAQFRQLAIPAPPSHKLLVPPPAAPERQPGDDLPGIDFESQGG